MKRSILIVLIVFAVGCSKGDKKDDSKSGPGDGPARDVAAKEQSIPKDAAPIVPPSPPSNLPGAGNDLEHLLNEEPAGALSVKEAKVKAKDGDAIVLVGRIGGHERPWVEGRASFLLVDLSLKSCRDIEGDNCKTPWDYCCVDPDELRKGIASIKFVDDEGKTLQTDARKLLGVKELQTLVIQGKAKRDDGGNLVVHASGVFIRPDKKK